MPAWEHIASIGRRAFWDPHTVPVTGAGPIGLFAALTKVQHGGNVHVLGRASSGPKPTLVKELGATYHTGPLAELGLRPDIVVECTGVFGPIQEAIQIIAPGGIACLTGVGPAAAPGVPSTAGSPWMRCVDLRRTSRSSSTSPRHDRGGQRCECWASPHNAPRASDGQIVVVASSLPEVRRNSPTRPFIRYSNCGGLVGTMWPDRDQAVPAYLRRQRDQGSVVGNLRLLRLHLPGDLVADVVSRQHRFPPVILGRVSLGDTRICVTSGRVDTRGHGGKALDQQAAIGTQDRVPILLAT